MQRPGARNVAGIAFASLQNSSLESLTTSIIICIYGS